MGQENEQQAAKHVLLIVIIPLLLNEGHSN